MENDLSVTMTAIEKSLFDLPVVRKIEPELFEQLSKQIDSLMAQLRVVVDEFKCGRQVEMSLKLYVWEGIFEMWWCSVVFALAESEEQARQLIRDKIMLDGGFGDESEEREFEDGFKKSPEVYSLPTAYCVWGGY